MLITSENGYLKLVSTGSLSVEDKIEIIQTLLNKKLDINYVLSDTMLEQLITAEYMSDKHFKEMIGKIEVLSDLY